MSFNINNVMSVLGLEGFDHEEHLTEEQEMLNEIALEAELDTAFAEMDAANTMKIVSDVQMINIGLAEREVSLESNKDASEVYASFGLEAIKDVAARHAYSGMASIKSLINTIISWLKNLLGIHTSSKKIFTGLNKKAKDELKALNKYAGRNMEKLKRTMPDYKSVIETLFGNTWWGYISASKFTDGVDEIEKNIKKVTSKVSGVASSTKTIKDKHDKINEVYDKKDTTEYEGSESFNKVRAALQAIQNKTNSAKKDDITKNIKTAIDKLQKINSNLHKENLTPDELTEIRKKLNLLITRLNLLTSLSKSVLKKIVLVSDDAITMARGIQAAL